VYVKFAKITFVLSVISHGVVARVGMDEIKSPGSSPGFTFSKPVSATSISSVAQWQRYT
jgi:mannitol-specific phosphotransferase system IIBC component